MARHCSVSREAIACIAAALEERARSREKALTITAIAKRYGVSRAFVRQVARGKVTADADRPSRDQHDGVLPPPAANRHG